MYIFEQACFRNVMIFLELCALFITVMETFTNETAAMFVNNEFKVYILPVSAIFGIFSVVGILGNLFVLYVHLFKYKSCNFRLFVLGLCAVDLTSSVTILPLEIYTQLNWYVFPSLSLCKVKAFINVFTSVASIYVLLLIAIDRHRKVCAPYGWQMTNESVLKGYAICFILTCCQCWSVIVVWGLQQGRKIYHSSDVYVTVCSSDPAVKDTIWPKVFALSMCPHFIAILIMLILYVLVGRQIFGVVLTLRQQSTEHIPKSALKKRNELNVQAEISVNPEISAGLTSSDDQIDSNKNADQTVVKPNNVNNCEPRSERRKATNMKLADKQATDNKKRPLCQKKPHSKQARKLSVESKDSTDFELVIYEIEDNGICMKKSKIAKTSKKRKRKPKPKPADLVSRKPKYTDSLKRKVRFSVSAKNKLRRRTLITFVFTAIFIGTTILYMTFSFRVAHDNATQSLSFRQLAVFLFFYRLYFINSVIHPILYGFLDPRFRKTLKTASKKVIESVIRSIHEPEHNADK